MDDLSQARWKKASYSNGGSACVEVAGNLDTITAVRDSKRPDDGAIVFDRGSFARFLDDVKEGSFDL
ncbi:MAG: DUF397 domain-containing protein [Streptosporangiales bacterium]|nr:DUF397 domain-containing protein [Streptosporangiales bacterium]MBO0889474.1 DUF397 domain-containing protein [Acidothermales bacterium]